MKSALLSGSAVGGWEKNFLQIVLQRRSVQLGDATKLNTI